MLWQGGQRRRVLPVVGVTRAVAGGETVLTARRPLVDNPCVFCPKFHRRRIRWRWGNWFGHGRRGTFPTAQASSVAKQFPNYLRLHVEEPTSPPPTAGDHTVTARLCGAFRRATGWNLSLREGSPPKSLTGSCWTVNVCDDRGQTTGFLQLARSASGKGGKAIDQVAARLLAESLAATLSQLVTAQRAVWRREAELAACVPVLPQRDSDAELAVRLEAALRAGAEAIGCQAAGLYLLDDATTELKLRSAWGLPSERLLAPARPLAGQMADLEALLGHAVVLEGAAQLPAWQPPENFPAAVCVPVSTSAMSIGTLWAFCREPRAFSDRDTNTWELAAGRIALELERQVLLAEVQGASVAAQQRPALAAWQRHVQPALGQLVEDWESAGWCESTGDHARVWYDWLLDNENRLLMIAGATELTGWEATLGIQSARTALRTIAHDSPPLVELCQKFHQAQWSSLHVDPQASVWIGRLDPCGRQLQYAAQGNVAAWLGHTSGARPLAPAEPAPVTDECWTPTIEQMSLHSKDVLMVAAAPSRLRVSDNRPPAANPEKALSALVRTGAKQPATRLAEALRALPDWRSLTGTGDDRVGLVLRGRPTT